jgi:hypothetical protein
MILANSSVLRLRVEKQRAKPVPPQFPVTPPGMIVLSEAQVRFARAGFSSVRDGSHCWLRYGANKGPTART